MKTYKAEAAAKIQFGIARACDFEKLSKDDIQAIKTDDSVTHHRFVERGVMADATDEENMTCTHIASTEHVDSMGDVIKVAGWDLYRLKGGVLPFFWGHDAYPIPLGKVMKAKRGKCDDGVKCLETTERFYEQELYKDSEWGKHVASVRELVMRGDMPGVSVGFAPKAYHWPDQEERDALGITGYGMVFDEQELLELSVTPIPANNRAQQKKSQARVREALRDLVNAGKLTEDAAKALEPELTLSEDAWLGRAKALSKTVVSVGDTSWMRGGKTKTPPAEPSPQTEAGVPMATVEEACARIERAASEALAKITKQVRAEAFAVSREIIEPLEASTLEAAERIERACAQIETKTADSERAEVSGESAPNGASAASDVSTGTSRDNPTNPPPSRVGETLLRVLNPDYRGTDTTHGTADRRDEAQGLQE